jgi:hypothetical protein
MTCRAVQSILPEYVAGRSLGERDRIAGHLCRCLDCDALRRELEAVFSLLEGLPEPPESPYGERVARLALHTEVSPGPARANQELRRQEDRRQLVGALGSFLAAAGAVALIVALGGPKASLFTASQWVSGAFQGLTLWQKLPLAVSLLAMVTLVPVLALSAKSQAHAARPHRRV